VSCELQQGDIRDPGALRKVFSSHRFDGVMHFAAKCLVGESVQNPLLYFDVNVRGTLALVQAMQAAEVQHLVFSSTCAVYGQPKRLPLDESHPQDPMRQNRCCAQRRRPRIFARFRCGTSTRQAHTPTGRWGSHTTPRPT
jgi:UDP-glucose 4-epimerase